MPLRTGAIVAVSSNFIIGVNNRLPFGQMSDDMKNFKETTLGQIVIMGYKTWLSIRSKPLPQRWNIVLTTTDHPEFYDGSNPTVKVARSLDDALLIAEKIWLENHSVLHNGIELNTAWFIGGETVYHVAISRNLVDIVHITFIEKHVDVKETDDVARFDKNLILGWELDEHVGIIKKNEKNENHAIIRRYYNTQKTLAISAPVIDDNPWVNIRETGKLPVNYGDYEVYRKGAGKQHYETWNNTGWAYNNNDITHWRKKLPPTN